MSVCATQELLPMRERRQSSHAGQYELTTQPETGIPYESGLWRASPDISFTLNAPRYARLFSQILFAHDDNPTGSGKGAEWWGGSVQAEAKPFDSLVTYARYDWIDADRFDDTGITVRGIRGTIGTVDPRLWDMMRNMSVMTTSIKSAAVNKPGPDAESTAMTSNAVRGSMRVPGRPRYWLDERIPAFLKTVLPSR